MSSQFKNIIQNLFGGTRKNKKTDIRGIPSTITISSNILPLTPPASPKFNDKKPDSVADPAFSITDALIPTFSSHRHTKKSDKKRQNSLRRRAILQAYARKNHIDY